MAGYIGKSQSVSLSSVSTGTVETQDIQDGAVTNVKVASGVDASKLTTGTLPIARISDGAITDAKIDGMSSSKLSGALPAIDGSALTGITTGKILQVVNGYTSGGSHSFTSGYDNTFGPSVSITPSSTSNKILIFVTGNIYNTGVAESQADIEYNATSRLILGGDGIATNKNATSNVSVPYAINFLHSPATTSTISYKVIGHFVTGSGTVYNGVRGSNRTIMTLMEIAG